VTTFVTWCGFFGAWFLLAGPVYQAALELHEQELERDRIAETTRAVDRPAPISPWWWLLPPVRYLLERRRQGEYRQLVLRSLDPELVGQVVDYLNKAVGWLLVGTGGLLIAMTQTWELVEHYEWPTFVFWLLDAVMTALALGFTVSRNSRSRDLVAKQASR
jgi:hypothetical protein